MYEKIKETAKFLKDVGIRDPEFGIILGTGLGGVAKTIQIERRIPYHDIPNFPVSTVSGHTGALIYGELSGRKVVAMQGRFHYYEGWEMDEVTFPVRVMKLIGVEKLVVSNASGGVNPDFEVGDIMIISDHVNFMPEHPLRGENDARFGPRFVDMHEPYSLEMIKTMKEIARGKRHRDPGGGLPGSPGTHVRDACRVSHGEIGRCRFGRHEHGSRGNCRKAHGHGVLWSFRDH